MSFSPRVRFSDLVCAGRFNRAFKMMKTHKSNRSHNRVRTCPFGQNITFLQEHLLQCCLHNQLAMSCRSPSSQPSSHVFLIILANLHPATSCLAHVQCTDGKCIPSHDTTTDAFTPRPVITSQATTIQPCLGYHPAHNQASAYPSCHLPDN